MSHPASTPSPFAFHPLDIQAKTTGQIQTERFSCGKDQLVWMFFPSGFQILAPLKQLPTVDASLVIRHGHFHDVLEGTAHALEHLIIKDVRMEGPHPLFRPLVRHGLEWNAYTNWERTLYWGKTTHRSGALLIQALLRIVNSDDLLTADRLEKERPAILQECRGRTEERRINDALFRELYPHIPRFHTASLGSVDTISRLQIEDLRQAHKEHYTLGNMALVVEGIDSESALLEAISPDLLALLMQPRTHRREEGPLADYGRTDDFSFTVEERPHVERVWMRTPRLFVAPEQTELFRKACGILEPIFQDMTREELRRKRGIIYAASFEALSPRPDEQVFQLMAKMSRDRMQEAITTWRELWPNMCRNLLRPKGALRLFLDDALGAHTLNAAKERRLRWVNHGLRLVERWMEQLTHPYQQPFTHYSATELRKSIKETTETLSALPWQSIELHTR